MNERFSDAEVAFRAGRSPIWHPFTVEPFPGPRTLWRRASGAYVWNDEGQRFFDATSSWWCITHGHCHPRLVEALKRQAEAMDQVMLSPHGHRPALELASKLLTRLGPPFAKVFYSDDGSTAVEAALKMAVQYWQQRGEPQRTKFIGMELGYHGDTLGAVSVSHVSEFHRYFEGLGVPCFRATAPYCYRCPLGLDYPRCHVACLHHTEAFIDEHGKEIAALVVEPLVLGAGGMITYPTAYLDRLAKKCRDKGILLIFDEVFTGFGRTGTLFAHEQSTIKPDFLCLSKGLTGGMLPLAVTVTTGEVFDAFVGPGRTFHHGHTFTGNPLSASVALASLEVFEEEGTLEKIARIASTLESWTPRFRELDAVGDVRHRGGIWALELVTDRATRRLPDPPNGPGWRLAAKLWEAGYWLRPLGNVLYLIPPYCSSDEDLHGCLRVLYSEVKTGACF